MQSDYIKYKKIATNLENGNLPSILNSGSYTQYMKFSLENQISNTKQINSQLTLPTKTIINDIETINVSTCTPFIICHNTNLRTNRILNINQGNFPCIHVKPPLYSKGKSIQNLKICSCLYGGGGIK